MLLLQVQTEFSQLSETQFVATVVEADRIQHAAVFLTGAAPLPPGSAGMVYWSWPDPAAPPAWQLLGHVSNSKPSAIFKISNLKKLHELAGDARFNDALGRQQICHDAQIGIAVEPEANVALLANSMVSHILHTPNTP